MSQLLPGLQPYTPTKIEWLALDLNATHRRDAIFDDKFKYEIFYVASDPDTILIAVQYFPDANREGMNLAVETAREVVESAAQSRGWQWVQIREQYLRQEYP